jgi:hypothetical protein
MKIRMPNVFDGATRTLVVAGTFAFPASVLAQTAPHPPQEMPAVVSRGMEDTRLLPQTVSDAHMIEMKVELAWLADPVTSYCPLEAWTVGSTLEVHGQVPSEADQAHALQLAREGSGMRVVSKLVLNPRLRAPANRKPQDVLHREAFNALQQRFPQQATAITVSTLADSQIVLKGTVPTYEDKLAISRHLRQATACSCISNQLQVLAAAQAHAAHKPEAQAKESTATLLPPERLKSQTIQPVADLPHVDLAVPATLPPAPPAVVAAHKPDTPAKKSSDARPAPEAPPVTAAKPAAKPVVYTTKWRRLDPSEVAMPKKSEPPGSSKAPADAKKPEKSSLTSMQQTPSANENSNASSGSRALAKADTAVVSPNPERAPIAGTSTSRPQYVMASAANVTPAMAPPAGFQVSSPGKSTPYVADGVVLIDSTFKPAAPSQQAMGPKSTTVARTGPYVTNGVILLSDSTEDRLSELNPALAALQTRLRQRIADICGKTSRDVEVRAITETQVAVRVRANSTLEGEELSNRIMQLPELRPCQVSLDVLVMK